MIAADLQELLTHLGRTPEAQVGPSGDKTKHDGLQGVTIFANGVVVARYHCARKRFESLEDLVGWLNTQREAQ